MGNDNANCKTVDNKKIKRGFALHPELINRKGRPPRGWAWADVLTEIAERVDPKSGKPFKEAVGEALFKRCLEGDTTAIKAYMDRMDGLPSQHTDITTGGKPLTRSLLSGLKNVHNNDSSREDQEDGEED